MHIFKYLKQFLKHAALYSNEIIDELNLNSKSFVVEVASNDGYLLKNFVEKNIPCLGIEPTTVLLMHPKN